MVGISLVRDYLRERRRQAAEVFREGADLVRPYARKLPGSPVEQLLEKLEAGYRRALDALDGEQDQEKE